MNRSNQLGLGRLGILGGMGTAATAHFLQTLARRSRAKTDQDHIPYLLLSSPEIPDRSHAIEVDDNNVPDLLLARCHSLESAGCGAIAIACNTAHYWRRRISSELRIPLIDILAATTESAVELGANSAVVLGTRATVRYRLYADALEAHGIQSLNAGEKTLEATWAAIVAAKAGKLEFASSLLASALADSRALGPDVIILGCTELLLALPPTSYGSDLIDSELCLADACIRWWKNEHLSPIDQACA